jgi:hypothetical protein
VTLSASTALGNWLKSHREYRGATLEIGISIGGETRGADAAVWHRDEGAIDKKLLRFPPLLVVEVAGQDEGEEELRDKAAWYLGRGVKTVWLVLTETREVVVLRTDAIRLCAWSASRCSSGAHPPVQPPPEQLVTHKPDVWQRKVQPPPEHAKAQSASSRHFIVQPPPEHVNRQLAFPEQVELQFEPEQVCSQSLSSVHSVLQPPGTQLNLQSSLASQRFVLPCPLVPPNPPSPPNPLAPPSPLPPEPPAPGLPASPPLPSPALPPLASPALPPLPSPARPPAPLPALPPRDAPELPDSPPVPGAACSFLTMHAQSKVEVPSRAIHVAILLFMRSLPSSDTGEQPACLREIGRFSAILRPRQQAASDRWPGAADHAGFTSGGGA